MMSRKDALDVVEVWVDKLRSGKYEQNENHLKDDKEDGDGVKHCCLGVLCEIALNTKVEKRPHLTHPDRRGEQYYAEYKGEMSYTEVPPSLGEDLGLKPTFLTRLQKMNDGGDSFDKKSFDEIADYIEQTILKTEGRR